MGKQPPFVFLFISLALLNFLTANGSSFAATIITLEQPLHFLTVDGNDVLLQPGDYQVRAAEEWLQLIQEGGQKWDAILLEAERSTHEERGELPQAMILPGEEEDWQHIVLLLPDGLSLQALGTLSGIRPRGLRDGLQGASRPNLSPDEIKHLMELKQIADQNRATVKKAWQQQRRALRGKRRPRGSLVPSLLHPKAKATEEITNG